MDLGIRGKTALVLGASSGIGGAIALALAAEGARIAVAARSADALAKIVAVARTAGADDAAAFLVDLSDEASIEHMLHDVGAQMGPPEIVVLNGGGPKAGTFSQVTLSDWDTAYATLLRAMVQIANGVLPGMRAAGWGRIVALTSTSVKQPIGNLTLSNALRVGLVAAMKTLAAEVAADGITVNSIATGRVRTKRLEELYGSDEAMDRAAEAEVPMGRVTSPAEFAPLIAFLCSDPARYITGQTIAIDGGLTKGLFG